MMEYDDRLKSQNQERQLREAHRQLMLAVEGMTPGMARGHLETAINETGRAIEWVILNRVSGSLLDTRTAVMRTPAHDFGDAPDAAPDTDTRRTEGN